MKNAETTVAKLVEVALRRYAMIREGDRILVAVSGGKDSLALAYDLARKRSWWPLPFELRALHLVTDLGAAPNAESVRRRLEGWGIETQLIRLPVLGRLKAGKSMNCYWCATQRRTELIRYALDEGFGAIALGHHLDDALETLLMNMLDKGQISSMPPSLAYDKYPLRIIRPLILCEERQIEAFAAEKGFGELGGECEYDGASKRRMARSRLEGLTGGSSALKRNLFASLSNVNDTYLPRPAAPRPAEGSAR